MDGETKEIAAEIDTTLKGLGIANPQNTSSGVQF
jgi:hypothetical protein